MHQSYGVCFLSVHIYGVNVVYFCVVPSNWRFDECRKAEIVGLSLTCGDLFLSIELSFQYTPARVIFWSIFWCVNLVHIHVVPYIY